MTLGFFVVTMFTAACSGGDAAGTSPTQDAGVDARVDSATVACTEQSTAPSGPTYVCGTCATDAIYTPACVNGALVCVSPSPPNLVQCTCGVLGLNTGCCNACGERRGSFSCAASGKWECPTGLTACGRFPKPCLDGGSDASDASNGDGG